MSDPASTIYPFDPTGQATTNAVPNEQHAVTGASSPNFNIIVPTFAPYFPDYLTVTAKDPDGTVHTLHEGIDYLCTHVFYTASLRTAKRVAGSISLINYQYNGLVSVTYQTVGGVWTLDTAAINAILANAVNNPRLTTWEQVTYRPYDFPPIDHNQSITDFIGASDLATAINTLEAAIRASGDQGGTVTTYDALTYALTTGQSIPDSAPTTLTAWTLVADRMLGDFTATTGVFAAPIAALYEISAQLIFGQAASAAVGNQFSLLVLVNGVMVSTTTKYAESATPNYQPIVMPARLFSLNPGDLVMFQLYQNSGAAVTLLTVPGVNWLTITRPA